MKILLLLFFSQNIFSAPVSLPVVSNTSAYTYNNSAIKKIKTVASQIGYVYDLNHVSPGNKVVGIKIKVGQMWDTVWLAWNAGGIYNFNNESGSRDCNVGLGYWWGYVRCSAPYPSSVPAYPNHIYLAKKIGEYSWQPCNGSPGRTSQIATDTNIQLNVSQTGVLSDYGLYDQVNGSVGDVFGGGVCYILYYDKVYVYGISTRQSISALPSNIVFDGRLQAFNVLNDKNYQNYITAQDVSSVAVDSMSIIAGGWVTGQWLNSENFGDAGLFGSGGYIDKGYLEIPFEDVVSSTSPFVFNPSTSSIINNINVNVDLSQTNSLLQNIVENTNRISSSSAVNIDLSSVTSRQDRLYDFLKSTAGVDYSQFCSSCIINSDVNLSSAVHTTSTTIWGAYTDLENYFNTNFDKSIVWDCKFHFSTITFLGTPIVLGDVDLCENYGEYFNLLKALLRLGFIVSGCFIFYRGVM